MGASVGQTVAASASAETTGATSQYGRYEILSKLATGGMGEVFLARSVGAAGFSKFVVIKKILPHLLEQPQFVEGLVREAKLLVLLDHPNIVQVLDLGVEGRDYFMAMEYVHGYNLATIAHYCAQRRLVIPASLCAYVAVEVLEGLEYAHGQRAPDGTRHNIIHRDVSPQNVLISRDGRVKLTDFGIAKVVNEAEAEVTKSLKGKFRYMAPEAVEGGRIDHRYDLFAVGILLFEALCRRHLFGGRTDLDILNQVRETKIPQIARFHPEAPSSLVAAVERSLRRDPEERFQSAGEFAAALRETNFPSTDAELEAQLRSFVVELYDRPDFPINKPKLPDLNKAQRPTGETRPLVLRSHLSGEVEVVGRGRRASRGSALIAVLSVGFVVISAVVAYLAYAMLYRRRPDPGPKAPVIIVSPNTPRGGAGAGDGGRTPATSAIDASAVALADGRRKPVRPPVRAFTEEMGAQAFRRSGPALTRCFNAHGPTGEAEVRLNVLSTVRANGSVGAVRLEPPAQGGTELGRCVIGVASRVQYPRHNKPEVTFLQPVRLRRTER
ncbi:MAG: serine/threonine protein kinase [Deltaproteobacteria bacterium]|nr:serine/threonine protein kinase [Deltaproteobacteria bacterium]